jgi:hypothetical protein
VTLAGAAMVATLGAIAVRASASGNTSDKTVYVRGVLDVPLALDTHTTWVEIPAHTNLIYPPKQVKSGEANSPWGTPTSRVEECSPSNNNGEAIPAFATLLTNLF